MLTKVLHLLVYHPIVIAVAMTVLMKIHLPLLKNVENGKFLLVCLLISITHNVLIFSAPLKSSDESDNASGDNSESSNVKTVSIIEN